MNKILTISLCCFLTLIISACQNTVEVVDGSEKNLELETALFSENDFALRIDTLPYRGAVLFIDYKGEHNLDTYELWVDILLNDNVIQDNMPVEDVDGNMIAEIVDLMYLPDDELDFVLKIKEEENSIFECYHTEQLLRYPWKDWMFAEDELITLCFDGNCDYPNFIYDAPSHPNKSGSHSAWDFMTKNGNKTKVYSATIGVTQLASPSIDNLEIYNPHVGAILQYGHSIPVTGLGFNMVVMPGEHISNTTDDSIHYAVFRPYQYIKKPLHSTNNLPAEFPDEWKHYYWPIPYDNHGLYDDPFYLHEPTTLGYWNEETLPPGLIEEMLSKFQKANPGLILPAKIPSGGKLTFLTISHGRLTPYFTEAGSTYTIEVGHDVDNIDINATLSDTDATMKINGKPTESGRSISISLNDAGQSTDIMIVITAVDGVSTRTYDLTVNRVSTP